MNSRKSKTISRRSLKSEDFSDVSDTRAWVHDFHDTLPSPDMKKRLPSPKQVDDMEAFFGEFIKDDKSLLLLVCDELSQYTVETLLCVQIDRGGHFISEIMMDAHLSYL